MGEKARRWCFRRPLAEEEAVVVEEEEEEGGVVLPGWGSLAGIAGVGLGGRGFVWGGGSESWWRGECLGGCGRFGRLGPGCLCG